MQNGGCVQVYPCPTGFICHRKFVKSVGRRKYFVKSYPNFLKLPKEIKQFRVLVPFQIQQLRLFRHAKSLIPHVLKLQLFHRWLFVMHVLSCFDYLWFSRWGYASYVSDFFWYWTWMQLHVYCSRGLKKPYKCAPNCHNFGSWPTISSKLDHAFNI